MSAAWLRVWTPRPFTVRPAREPYPRAIKGRAAAASFGISQVRRRSVLQRQLLRPPPGPRQEASRLAMAAAQPAAGWTFHRPPRYRLRGRARRPRPPRHRSPVRAARLESRRRCSSSTPPCATSATPPPCPRSTTTASSLRPARPRSAWAQPCQGRVRVVAATPRPPSPCASAPALLRRAGNPEPRRPAIRLGPGVPLPYISALQHTGASSNQQDGGDNQRQGSRTAPRSRASPPTTPRRCTEPRPMWPSLDTMATLSRPCFANRDAEPLVPARSSQSPLFFKPGAGARGLHSSVTHDADASTQLASAPSHTSPRH